MVSLVPVVLLFAQLTVFPQDKTRKREAPPLSLKGLLDEKLPVASKSEVKIKVDNSACYVCHDNYEREELVVTHGKEETGCIDCHGESLAHRDDEDNITPPDKMFTLSDIDRMCGDCHEDHDVPARKVIQRWQQRCPAKMDPKQLVCTDCHFQHRLRFRTVWWDKKTRKLVIRKKGQRTTIADDSNFRRGQRHTDGRKD